METVEQVSWKALKEKWIKEALRGWEFGHSSGTVACDQVLDKAKELYEKDRFALLNENIELRKKVGLP